MQIREFLLDLPDVEPDDSEGQTLLPVDRSRSVSPAPRDFLGVTSQTVTDPLELATSELRAWVVQARHPPSLVLNHRWTGLTSWALGCHQVR